MGVTIHYRGRLNDPALLSVLCDEVRDIAECMQWPYTVLDDDWDQAVDAKLVGAGHIEGNLGLKGILIKPHPESEYLTLLFDRDGYLRCPLTTLLILDGTLDPDNAWVSIKTQFAGSDTHIWLVGLLRYVKRHYISDLDVSDESEYWEKSDPQKLEDMISLLAEKMNEISSAIQSGGRNDWAGLSADEIVVRLEELLLKRTGDVEGDDLAEDEAHGIDLSQSVDLVVLGITKGESARCRVMGRNHDVTLRTSGLSKVVPGEIITVVPSSHWTYDGIHYLSGSIMNCRLDVSALNLNPLGLTYCHQWDPSEHYWGEEEDTGPQDWERELKSAGPRPLYKLQNRIPGEDPADLDSDPIIIAAESHEADDYATSFHILNELLIADLRCIDAHAHLGHLEFDDGPDMAIRHYRMGVEIGNLSLGANFNGVLPWGIVSNRPYLRCLHGYELCLWRLHRYDEAEAVCLEMPRLNPDDNQGIRFNLESIRNRLPWEECSEM